MAEEIEIPLASTDKYEEALAKARFEYKENPFATEGEKKLLEIIFPELTEIDDEKIRESLLRHFRKKYKTKPYWNEIAVKDIIAYLEKLKDVETEIERAYKNADKIQYEKGFEDGVASVKPAEWSEEDEKMLKDVYESLYAYQCDIRAGMMDKNALELLEDVDKEKAWLKSLRPQSHWRPSEEQMDVFVDALYYLPKNGFKDPNGCIESLYNDLKKL